jgi:hypothetical protein
MSILRMGVSWELSQSSCGGEQPSEVSSFVTTVLKISYRNMELFLTAEAQYNQA